MAAPLAFSGQATGQRTCFKAIVGVPTFLPAKTCQIKSNDLKSIRRQICMKARAKAWIKPSTDRRLKGVMSPSVSNSDIIISNPLSPSDIIKLFYTSINEKNLNRLSGFISHDCFFDDFSFSKPFQGKKEVMEFLGQLIASMGQNLEFKIGLVCEGDDFTAGVTWHLEWNKKRIPFTRGCSFYECSMEGTKLVIKKAQVVIESPMKLGGSVMILLKIVTSLFDAFPKATEWFLKSPHVILQVILKILGRFVSPFLAWYINLWKFMARLFGCTVKILLYISKVLYK